MTFPSHNRADRPARLPALLLLAALGLSLFAAGAGAQVRNTGKRWIDMDYGPYMTHSFQASRPDKNIAYKGLKIRLGDDGQAMLFDTDLLRFAGGWQSSDLDWRSVVYDGSHNSHPRVTGEPVFSNAAAPGWAKDGKFDDPRKLPWGPLPRDWAHWKGLYTHGNSVVLSYTVGDAAILELPALKTEGDAAALTRAMQIGKSSADLVLQVGLDGGQKAQLVGKADLKASDAAAVAKSIAVFGSLETADDKTAERKTDDQRLGKQLVAHWSFDGADKERLVANAVSKDFSGTLDNNVKRSAGAKGGGFAVQRHRPRHHCQRREAASGPRRLDDRRLDQNHARRHDRRPRPGRREMGAQRKVVFRARRPALFRHRLGGRRAIRPRRRRRAVASCGSRE